MAQSDRLRKEVAAMGTIERTLSNLPDDRTRARVVTWVIDNYAIPELDGSDPAADAAPDAAAVRAARGGEG